jgi:hypothetical protein
MTNNNIGQALLIIAALYFYYTINLHWVIVLAMCLLATLTWTYPGFSKERKRLIDAQVETLRAKAAYYRSKLCD